MVFQFTSRIVAATFFVALTSLGSGQTLFPSPEQQKMGYFAGNWNLQGTMKVSPNTPAGPFTATERSEWVKGNFFLETHSSMTSVLGETRSTRVMEYNPDDKV